MKKQLVRKSKFLSLVLRHDASAASIELDANGWASVTELLTGATKARCRLTMSELEEIVATNEKKRFAFNHDKSMIRASQGHSLNVDLELVEKYPPKLLLHGTATKNLDLIFDGGLLKMNRQHVHLSEDEITAIKVGSRHGQVIVLEIQAFEMYQAGFKFYQSANGVWLTDHVPVKFVVGLMNDQCCTNE